MKERSFSRRQQALRLRWQTTRNAWSIVSDVLSDEDREVITEYYRYKKTQKIDCRKRLAARLGISLNTLRVKMHRQRMNLEACVEKCLHDTNTD